MNKIHLILLFFLLSIIGGAQEGVLNTPLPTPIVVNSDKIQDHKEAYDEYWLDKDRFVRGNGFKQFQRWKEIWKHEVKEDGTVLTAWEIADSWNEIMNMKLSANEMDDDSDWTPLGPFTHTNQGSWSAGQGRTNVILVDPNHPEKIYVGTPDGGLWVSDNHGDSWAPLTIYLPSIGVSGIAIDYNDSNTIYITTGDKDASDSQSIGVFKTTDGGLTWNPTGATVAGGALMRNIYIHPQNSDILWAASTTGLFKTTNAGTSWVKTFEGNITDMRLKPGDPNTIYIIEQTTEPFLSILYKSTDGGENFTEIKTYNNAGRAVIDVTPANPEYLYVMVSNMDDTFQTLDRSTNSGNSFEVRNNTTDIYDGSRQTWFDMALGVSDTDPETIFTGVLNVWKSTNGGSTLSRGAEWSNPNAPNYTHADIHYLKFFNDKLYAATDGGIYISEDYGATFSDKTKNGLNIGQFYRIDVAPETTSKIVGGLQDNGGYAYVNNDWKNFYGGDGMDSAINPINSDYYYGFVQFGIYLYRFYAGNPSGDGQYWAEGPEDGNWVTPLEYSKSGVLYAGYSKLYRLQGNNFLLSSSTTFDPLLDYIRVDPFDDKRVLVSNYNDVFIAENQDSYPLQFEQLPRPQGGWTSGVSNIAFNQDNSNIIYVTTGARVFKSLNGGQSWENITYNIPSYQAKYVIAHQKGSANNTLYLATRNAVWYTDDTMTQWKLFNNNLPNSRVTDLEINTVEGHIVVSTYGRGVWRSPVAQSSLKVDEVQAQGQEPMIYPNPVTHGKAKLNLLIDSPAELTVTDLSGRIMKTQSFNKIDKETDLDFSNLSSGIYIVTIQSESHIIRKKIIIK